MRQFYRRGRSLSVALLRRPGHQHGALAVVPVVKTPVTSHR